MSRSCWWVSLLKPGLWMSPCALTSPMMTNRVTGLLKHFWYLLALSTNRVLTLPSYGGMRLQELQSHNNPLNELRRASSVIPWIALLGRKVLAVPPTSAAQERMFSSAGNIMTKKQARLSCDHLEELMYLHEVWPKVREWTVIKKARLA